MLAKALCFTSKKDSAKINCRLTWYGHLERYMYLQPFSMLFKLLAMQYSFLFTIRITATVLFFFFCRWFYCTSFNCFILIDDVQLHITSINFFSACFCRTLIQIVISSCFESFWFFILFLWNLLNNSCLLEKTV